MFLAMLHSLWDLSSPSRDQTSVPAVKVPSLNLWTTMEFPLCMQIRKHMSWGVSQAQVQPYGKWRYRPFCPLRRLYDVLWACGALYAQDEGTAGATSVSGGSDAVGKIYQ